MRSTVASMLSVGENATYAWSLSHGYIVRFGGPVFGLESQQRRIAWLRNGSGYPLRWVMPKQQHGSRIMADFIVSSGLDNRCDGFATRDLSLGLAVFGSDCPALVLVAPDGFAIAHCGWRGIASGIVANAVIALTSLGSSLSSIHAFVGPGICQECYNVGPDVLASTVWPNAALVPRSDGKALLSLSTVIEHTLALFGIGDVTHTGICTACNPNLHSYRHQGPGVVQVLAVHKA